MPKKRGAGKKILLEEKKIEKLQEEELKDLASLRKEIRKDTGSHPLTTVTNADIVRSIIGALIGTVGHFAFFYGVEIAEKISLVRATFLYLFSLAIGIAFMYYSGFRKVRELRLFRFIPMRITIVYIISMAVVILTLFVFGFVDVETPIAEIYKIVAATLLLAVLGASTADILGKDM